MQKFLAITLIITSVFAFLGGILVRGALSNLNNYVSYFMLFLGIGLMVLFVIVLVIAVRYSRKKELKEVMGKYLTAAQGTKFNIDLDTVRIKSNNWENLRFIEAHLQDIEIKEKKLQTILEFDVEINGEKKQFHFPTNLEPKSLEMYFAIQKETTFYLDPADHTNFFLDLSFIRT